MKATLLAVLAVGAVACAPDPSDTYSPVDAPPETRSELPTLDVEADGRVFDANGEVADVRALDNSFIAPTIEIVAGTEVRWFNGGRNDHDVLPVDESDDWGIGRGGFEPGVEYQRLFDRPGVYAYYCSIHGTKDAGMIGTVIVDAPA